REAWRRKPDVVQSFGRLAYLLPILPLKVPKIMSYQRRITSRTVRWGSRLARGSLYYTGCSRSVIEPVGTLGRWKVIYNAVPLERFSFAKSVGADAPLVFLGRVEFIKGAHIAI